MACRRLLALFSFVFTCVPNCNSTVGQKWASDPIDKLNDAFEKTLLALYNLPDSSVQKRVQEISGNPLFADVTETSLRLFWEGTVTGWVTLVEKPVQKGTYNRKKSLVLSGYGGKGAAALVVAKERVQAGENVTLLLIPSANCARGTRGIIKGVVNTHYEKLETWLRDWNNKNGKKITFVTIMDTEEDSAKFSDVEDLLKEADAELTSLSSGMENVKTALKKANFDENNEKFKRAVKEFAKAEPKYFSALGVPVEELQLKTKQVLSNVLLELGHDFDYCFEGHSGQGFVAAFGTLFSEPIMKYLVQIKKEEVDLTSTDYQLGMTENGLQKDIEQYEPNMMIVIFLRKSIIAKDNNKNHQLKNVKIVQIDWNTVCNHLFGLEVPANLKYSTVPAGITEGPPHFKLIKVNRIEKIKYRVFKSMGNMETNKVNWIAAELNA